MRQILFRGKRVDNDEWVYGFLRCGNYIDVWTPHTWKDEDGNTGEYATVETYQVDPETVGQYTGLTDKNGKKIFEGDIVGLEYGDKILSRGDMQFDYGVFGVEWTGFKKNKGMVGGFGQLHNLRRFDDGLADRIKVIGNIYDNPELLEVEND
nr:MAG TPA: YopX protein [Caudoviricetes sp.]